MRSTLVLDRSVPWTEKSWREIRSHLVPHMKSECGKHGIEMVFFMLTNIIEESTEMLCYGQDCAELVESAFPPAKVTDHAALVPGVVSRKKQVVPRPDVGHQPQQRGVEDEIRKEKNGGDGPSGLEAWKYAVPSPGGDGKLRLAGERPNIITVAWTGTVCSSPAMVSISVRPERHSYHMIRESGEFVINLTTEELGGGRGLLRRAVRPGCG